MKSIKKTFNRPLALAFAVLLGVITWQAFAMRPAGPDKPALVATVNLEHVYAGISEQNAAEARLRGMEDEIDAKLQGLRQEIEQLRNDLDVFEAGSQEKKQTEEQLLFKSFYLQQYQEQAMVEIDAEQARILLELYDRIKSTIARIAEENGYDLVLVDDSVVELPTTRELSPGGARREMMRQISARRLLYSRPQIDISQVVIDQMNQAFQAQQGG